MEDAKELAQRKLEERRFPLGIYKHRKGGRYVAFAVSLKEDTMEEVVHYFSIVRCTRWTRTLENFFELVEGKPRFEYVGRSTQHQLLVAAGLDR